MLVLIAFISSSQELNYKSYTISDGLPDMQVNGINIDNKGNLWVSTRGGISKFDGENFQNFDNIDCLPKYAFNSAEDKDGNIWIASSEHLIKFDGINCESYPYPEWSGAGYRFELSFIEDDLLLGCSPAIGNKAFLFKNGKFKSVVDSLNIEYPLKTIRYDTILDVFISVTPDSLNFYKNAQKVKSFYPETTSILGFTFGNIGLCTGHDQIYSTNGDFENANCFTTDDSLNFIQACQYLKGNNDIPHKHSFIDSNADRIYLYSQKLKKHYILEEYKSKFNVVWDIKEVGDYFFFVTDKGLIKWYPEQFYSYSEKELPYVWAVAESKDKEIYLGAYGYGIKKIVDNGLQKIETIQKICPNSEYPHNEKIHRNSHKIQLEQIYFNSCNDELGNTYLPNSLGISKLNKNNAEIFYNHCGKIKTKSPASLYSYYDPVNKNIISCHCNSVIFLDQKGKVTDEIYQDSLLNNSCVLTAVRHRDAMYFGYRPHVAKYKEGKVTLLSYPHSNVDETYICSIVDHRDNLWFGGKNGLYQIQNDSIIKFPFLEGKSIQSIIQYNPEKMFITTVDGLFMLNLENYYKTGNFQYRLYNHTNGYSGLEPNQNGLFIDSRDRLWITSSTVLSYTDINSLDYIDVNYNLGVSTINNQNVRLNTDTFSLEKNINSADVQLSLIGFDRPNDYYTSYSIDNNNPTPLSKNKYAHLEGLSSGIHRLNAKIFDLDNNLLVEKNFYLDVDIPFYNEPWWSNLLFIITIGFASLGLFYWYRSRNKEKERKLLATQNELIQNSAEQLEKLNIQLESENKILQTRIKRSLGLTKSKNEPLKLGAKNEFLIKPQSIIYAKSERNRLTIQLEDKPIFIYTTLRQFKTLLPDSQFAQINRSTIINIQKIKFKEIDRINMSNDEVLKMSKTGRAELEEVLATF